MKTKKNKKKKQVVKNVVANDYVVHQAYADEPQKKFGNLRAARKYALDLFRAGLFIRLENSKGVVLPLM